MARRDNQSILDGWRQQFPLYLLALGAWLTIYAWKLNSLLPGYSSNEIQSLNGSDSLHAISTNPVDAPFKLLSLLGRNLLHNQAGTRAAAVVFTLAFTLSFYLLAARWFGRLVAAFSTAILATTPIVLIASRSATPMIMAGSLLPAAAILLALPKTDKPSWLIYLLAITSGLAVYHPGLLWMLLLLLYLGRSGLRVAASKIGNFNLVGAGALFLAILAPLIYRVSQSTITARSVLALPQHWPSGLAVLKNFAWATLSLVWRAPYHVEWLIGRISVFSVIEVALVVIGTFAMLNHARSRALAVLSFCFLGVLVESVSGNLSFIIVIIPALMLLAAAGVRFLYYEWNGVFPSNPLPRTLANVALVSVVAVQCLWGVRYGLIAWPHSPSTRSTYHAIIKQ